MSLLHNSLLTRDCLRVEATCLSAVQGRPGPPFRVSCACVRKLLSHIPQSGLADLELAKTPASPLVLLCLSAVPPQHFASCYLDGPRGYLDMVQPPQCALSVDEVGGCQLVQGLQGHGRTVSTAPNDRSASCCFCLAAQFSFVHKNGQGLFSCHKQHGSIGKAFCSLIPYQLEHETLGQKSQSSEGVLCPC